MSEVHYTVCYICKKEEKTWGVGAPHDWYRIKQFNIEGIPVEFTEPRYACSRKCLLDLICNIQHECSEVKKAWMGFSK